MDKPYDLSQLTMTQRAMLFPVCGGSEAAGVATEGDTITVDGEEFSKSDLADFKNDQDWRKSNEDRSAENKRQEAAIAAERQALAEERRLAALEGQERVERTRVANQEKEEQADPLDLSGLPDPGEEPAAHAEALQNRMRDALANGQQKAADQYRRELKTATDQVKREVQGTNEQERVYRENTKTTEDYFNEMEKAGTPVDKSTQNLIKGRMDRMMRVEGLSEVDPSGVVKFTRDAVAAADQAARPDYWKNRWVEEGFQNGLTQRRRNGQADEVLNSNGKTPPGAKATPAELYEYGSDLPSASPQAQAFFDNLSPEQLDAYIKEDHARRVGEQMGGDYL
jgi:hypothetical protein